MDKDYWIKKLDMEEHIEGGYVKPVYESPYKINVQGERSICTSIYFLITEESFSHFHSLKSDEIWYYHAGKALTITIITPNGELQERKLGLNIDNGENPHILVPAGSIFAAHIPNGGGCTLVSCMVSYGFDYQDFKLYKKDELIQLYSDFRDIIEKLAT